MKASVYELTQLVVNEIEKDEGIVSEMPAMVIADYIGAPVWEGFMDSAPPPNTTITVIDGNDDITEYAIEACTLKMNTENMTPELVIVVTDIDGGHIFVTATEEEKSTKAMS